MKRKRLLAFKERFTEMLLPDFYGPRLHTLTGILSGGGGHLYFDVVLTMGLRIACYICQRITNALIYIYKHLGYEGINYLDDLGAAEILNKAWHTFWA